MRLPIVTKVKIEYPLKQGLKRRIHRSYGRYILYVKIEYPLKQGLKHNLLRYITRLSLLG